MPDENGVIATHYRIDPAKSSPPLAGGLRTFVVTDRRDPAQHLVAVETRADLPARPRIPLARGGPPVPHSVLPVEYGPGRDPTGKAGWFVVSEGWPAAPMQVGPLPWRESDIMQYVLQPAATALAELQARGLTHRAINPANLFRASLRDPVTLGPFWTAPAGSLQPSVFEPPYMARCLVNGRGDGSVADDIYALGVTLLCCALGRVPLADIDDAGILARKLEFGSFAALTTGATLTPLIADLLRGMLAEDPEHRPSPRLLLRPEQARARRVSARPPRRAEQPLNLGGLSVWSARQLAQGLGLRPERGFALLRSGEVEHWLRRCLGDPQLGMQVEQLTRRREDDAEPDRSRARGLLLMRCIAILDPLAPLVWRGIAVQPDGIGSALAGNAQDVAAPLEEIVAAQAVGEFCKISHRGRQSAELADSEREWAGWLASRGVAGGSRRLLYGMNPMMACTSPLLGGRPVVRAAELLPALEDAATGADRSHPPIDPQVAAFLAARLEPTWSIELKKLSSFATASDRLCVLRLFGRLQESLHPGPLPGLAGWLLSSGFAKLDDWHNRKARAALQDGLSQAAQQGRIAAMVGIVDDEAAKQADQDAIKAVRARVEHLEKALQEARAEMPKRAEAAQSLGYEIVTGAGLVASLGATLALALH